MATFPRLNDDHNTNNINDIMNGDYITHGAIDHDYSTHTLGYIDIGIKGYHLGFISSLHFGLCSSQTVHDPPAVHIITDPTAGGVRVYHG